ncbi:MAG TPA: phosphoenolpyruvate carboxykinase [Candidatus Bathyarchaeia archaeon]|nr:phosphoenolpyruvate carboxykinase [Candidatus Bathyarchaeia archaeon]
MEQLENVLKSVEELYRSPNVLHPQPRDVRRMAEQFGTMTGFSNYNFCSTVKNRSAGLTVYVGGPQVAQARLNQRQKELIRDAPKTVALVQRYLNKAPFVCVERTMGDNPYFTPYCTLFVSTYRKEMVRLAHMVSQTLFDPREGEPKLYLVYIPEWQEKDRQILVFPEIGVTYVLGSDYYGEAKKGFLRMAMWNAKQRGMLGLHAGAKIIRAKDRDTGKIKIFSALIFGLTATGKTTHTCHDHGLTEEGEGIEISQDDVVFMRSDGSALGTEKGFYLKTEGVNSITQPLIFSAVTKPDAIFENVMVDFRGRVDFDDETLTGNGRGIMQRDDFGKYKSETVNIPPAKELDNLFLFFITRRNTVVPLASKLSLEQAAAAFMLGESIETSGSDPKRAGESVREVGTNPFIIGNEAEEGNRFYEFLKINREKVQCYLLNTGGVGEIVEKDADGNRTTRQKVLRIQIPEMASIIRGIARGSIEWENGTHWNTSIPKRVEGMDMEKFNLANFYNQEQIDRYVRELREERIRYLHSFPGLDPEIANVFG